jgi:superfamily II DNA or RNA helicase
VNSGKIPGFISTVSKEGLDIPNLTCIINAGGGKAPHNVIQTIGRGVRQGIHPYCLYFDFNDLQNRNLTAHTRARMKALKSEQVDYIVSNSVPDIGDSVAMRKLAGVALEAA